MSLATTFQWREAASGLEPPVGRDEERGVRTWRSLAIAELSAAACRAQHLDLVAGGTGDSLGVPAWA
jgi:hypothetical protein